MGIIPQKRLIVLATASEARRKLVSDTGLDFLADAVSIDETPFAGESIDNYVLRLAKEKANACMPAFPDALIIAVDTAVGLDGAIIGKPADEKHAREMLALLSGRTHEVVSAIALRDAKNASVETDVTRTLVRFDKLSGHAVDWYIGTGEWKGRAGAYAIQGKGSALVAEVRGCFTNVIGISIPKLLKMIESFQNRD